MRRVRTPAVRVQTVHGTTANTRTRTHTHTLTLSRSHSTAVHGTTTNTYATPALLAGRDGQGVKYKLCKLAVKLACARARTRSP